MHFPLFLYNRRMQKQSPPKPSFSFDPAQQQIELNSNRIGDILRKQKAPLNSLRSLRPLLDEQLSPHREESFDKIINRFELNKIKENLHIKKDNPPPIMTAREDPSCQNKAIFTERVKNNLSKLKNRYCLLPQLNEARNNSISGCEIEAGQEYDKFEKKVDSSFRLQSGERKPLGLLKLGKLKYQQSMVLLHQ